MYRTESLACDPMSRCDGDEVGMDTGWQVGAGAGAVRFLKSTVRKEQPKVLLT